jgi:hypothetical protein
VLVRVAPLGRQVVRRLMQRAEVERGRHGARWQSVAGDANAPAGSNGIMPVIIARRPLLAG